MTIWMLVVDVGSWLVCVVRCSSVVVRCLLLFVGLRASCDIVCYLLFVS